ncbi:efflux RND transporter permease subunit [Psychrosphaera aestuarii]|uniref:efflux RND transporter permease subunit n=1 Tax=Psychrosphaera aestuarii TaxID=1266052 RepID=UPI001B33F3C4|nr:efflux RND transporter permease subunit [Psychrosphaera aestuarii]
MLHSVNQYLSKNIRLLGLLLAMVFLLGGNSLLTMPKAEDPQFLLPINVVEVIVPGMSPLLLETQVIEPIERSLGLVENIKTIESRARHGSVNMIIKFIHGTNPEDGFDEIVRAVTRIRGELPDDVQNVIFFKASPTTVNVLQLAISHPDNDWQTIQRGANKLKNLLQALPNIQQSEVWGLPQLVVAVDVDPAKLIRYKVNIQEVMAAVAERGQSTHAGYIDDKQVRFTINLSGEYKDISQLQNTVIKMHDSAQITLADVASVKIDFNNPDNLAFVADKPVVFVTAQQRMGANIYELGGQVEQVLAEFSTSHPDLQTQTIFAQEDSVHYRINGFLRDLASGLLLILVCLFFFMGFKQSFWVSLALPITIFATLTIMNLMGFVLQQMTIAGLIVALGLLVDNSLVVVEQFVKVQDKVSSRIEAIKQVISDVGLPLMSGTLTTVFAFLPLLLLQSDTGDFMRALPVSVSISLLVSLVVALIVLPVLMSVFGVSKESSWTLSYKLNKFAEGWFSKLLNKLLVRPILVLLVFAVGLFACISLMSKVGVSLFPKAEKSMLVVNLETPVQSSLAFTQESALKLSEELQKLKYVKNVVTTVGATSPRIYYNHTSDRGRANYAQLMVIADNYEKDKIQSMINTIRTKYANSSLGKINVFEFQQGPVTDRPITFRILGDDLDQLANRAAELQAYIESLEHTFDVRNITAESGFAYDIKIDEIKAKQRNVDLASAEQQVSLMIDGEFAAEINDRFGQAYPILIRSQQESVDALESLYIKNNAGLDIPLSAIASIQATRLKPAFYHYQRIRMARVSADVVQPGNVAEITAKIEDYLQSLSWHNGLSYKVGGEEEARKESFGGLSQILIVVVVSIFVLLFIQFNSFAQPLVIISLLPIAFAGSVFGMFITSLSFSMMAFIGLISLIGIMVNDAIIVVDGFNRGRYRFNSAKEAMVASVASRFTPVILTSLTTVVGLLPLTLYGGDLWQPMGTVIITGLAFTTLASLIWVPALTLILTRRK